MSTPLMRATAPPLPTLVRTGLPVVLPTWLPTTGIWGQTFSPTEVGGMCP